ncbi:TIGR01459 family HAD-type hydrolase [Acidiphilium acidophilum]|uniref:TIGR01459 family HAD-type hydrolase n=1 Tax=Acidiphilium acidophilum TaxID=76588 RepID=A0AAW9DQT5_ACIAO|nr:TIGR01459 family HAD-type hydrolase [Acidiphilium acidophilum]MDX5931559.1 TIGR01459 family HAD-type hydrolase [Acidiphilium acidophilum]GBR76248.1 hydrolase IIA [Acidiphilium acidophilum DSM 700]
MSIADLAERYDGFIVDLWGVVHDGVHLYPGVIDSLARLRGAGRRVVFLSNAPRRAGAVAQALAAMGIAPGTYDGVMTSGEAVRTGLRDRTDPDFAALGRRFVHLGPARDRNLFEDLDLTEVAQPADAEFLLNTGPDDLSAQDDPAIFDVLLAESLKAGLPMVCANPDLEVIRDGRRIICAGLLAERYASWGGRVILRGKPDPAVYAPTLAMLGTARARTVAFGDSLRTDIAGAQAAGIDSVLVLTGIHTATPEQARRDCAQAMLDPVAILPGFIW